MLKIDNKIEDSGGRKSVRKKKREIEWEERIKVIEIGLEDEKENIEREMVERNEEMVLRRYNNGLLWEKYELNVINIRMRNVE